MEWQAAMLGILAMLNLMATVAVVRGASFSPAQRCWQVGVIWAIPLIGAVVCIQLARAVAPEAAVLLAEHEPDRCGADGPMPDYVPMICGCSADFGGGGDGGE